jgi:ABC-2 type transport system permease protein
MRETGWLVRRMAIETAKNYRMMLLYLALPLLGIALAYLMHNDPPVSPLRVAVVIPDTDQETVRDAIAFIGGLEQIELQEAMLEDAEGKLAAGELDAVIAFPADFTAQIAAGRLADVGLTTVHHSQAAAYIETYLNAYISNLASIGSASGGDRAAFDRLYAAFRQADFGLSVDEAMDISSQHRQSIQTLGYLVVFMLFSAVNLSGIILKEKENRTYQRLFAAPITARAYVAANVIVNVAVMLIQIAVTLLVMTRFFHMEPGIPAWKLFLLLGLFALVAVSLSLVTVALSSSSMAANGIQTMIIIPTCLVAGCLFPIGTMPASFQQIAHFLPQYWLLDTAQLMQQGEAASGLVLNLSILAAYALALALTAAYLFGRNKDSRTFI